MLDEAVRCIGLEQGVLFHLDKNIQAGKLNFELKQNDIG